MSNYVVVDENGVPMYQTFGSQPPPHLSPQGLETPTPIVTNQQQRVTTATNLLSDFSGTYAQNFPSWPQQNYQANNNNQVN